MLSDLRFALRSLAKTPGFTVIALLTLALGIGLNSAMFNIVNSLVLQPLKFPDAQNLFRLEATTAQQQSNGHRPAHFLAIARASGDFARVASARSWTFTLAEPDRPAVTLGSLRASAGYFGILGLPMALGREFRPDEDAPGHNQVAVLSHAFWLSHFNGDRDIIGRTVRIDGEENIIVGVASALASDPRVLPTPEIYRPLALTPEDVAADQVDHGYFIIGRYQPGVTAAQAETRLATITAELAAMDPGDYAGRQLHARPLKSDLQGTGRQIIVMLISLSGFVLLIACANLANLLLARAIARSREYAIRGALGASRAQLLRPLAAECVLLAVTGGALGVLVSLWTNDWMARQFSDSGSDIVFVLDWRLLLFAFTASLATGLFFGFAPAWLVARVRLNDALKSGARGATGDRSQNRFRAILIMGQFALALVLLSGAVFFVRGLDSLLQRDAGWNPAPLVRGILSLPSNRYPDPQRMMQFYERVQQRLTALPGAASATISYGVPAFGFPTGRGFVVEGRPPATPGNEPGATLNGIMPGYFSTVGTRLRRGREFLPSDREGAPRVIILNETMARTLFPGQEAVGHRLAYLDEKNPVWIEIVGVAEDVQFLNIGGGQASFQAYIPLAQSTWSYVTLSVRAAGPAATLLEPIRKAVGELDPDLAVKELAPAPDYIQHNLHDVRAINYLLVGFSTLGLLLAALGIYGVITRLVAQRTNEIGIRMALGAGVGQIARLIIGAGMRLVLAGTAFGLLGAVWLAHFLAGAMPGLSSGGSLTTLAGATGVLIAIALAACWLPARRATKVDPTVALRAE